MQRARRRLALASAVLLLAACTNDFGVFDFAVSDGGAPPGAEHDDSTTHGDAGFDATVTPPSTDASTDGATRDAATVADAGPQYAALPDAQADAATDTPDAGEPPDAQADAATDTPDSGELPDAQVDAGNDTPDSGEPPDAQTPAEDADVATPEDLCLTQWEATWQPVEECAACACAECAQPVNACSSTGSASEQAHCAAVLECAIANDCKDWTCYCTSPSCGSPSLSGNGPCAAQMDAAAAGARTEVMAIREAGDPSEPLVRAMNAIGCVLGLDSRSPGGPQTGQCDAPCP